MRKDRRDFVKKAGLGAAGLSLIPGILNAQKSKMKIGVQLYTVRDQMAENLKGTLKTVADLGYNYVESAGYSEGKMYGLSPKEFNGILDDLGLQHMSVHIPLAEFQNNFNRALDFMLESDQKFGVLPWLREEDRRTIDQYKSYADLLNRTGELALKEGIQICYHNHDFEFWEVDGQIPMDVLLGETEKDLVQIELDLYWVSKAGQDAFKIFADNPGRFPLWHVKDMANTEERGFTEVGNGVIDYKALFAKSEEAGMKYFFVEQDRSDNPLRSIETSVNNLRNVILTG